MSENTEKDTLKGSTKTITREIIEKTVSTDVFLKTPSNLIRSFVRVYIEQGFQNAAEAARKAGSQAKNPNQVAFMWLKDPWVQREIEVAKELISQGKDPVGLLHEDDVLARLMNVYNMALADRKYDPALKAVEMMGRHLGMFIVSPQGHTNSKTLTLRETQTLGLNQDADRLSHLSSVLKDSTKEPVIITHEKEPLNLKSTELPEEQ